jgi:hypothetical protein
MPFDGIERADIHPLAKLGAVERLLSTEQQWCKGRLRDAHGRHCLVGAIEAVDGRQVLQRIILQAAREVSGKRYWRIEFFNDDPRTTHADILEVLRHARENIIAGMVCEALPRRRRWLRSLRSTWAPPARPYDMHYPVPADYLPSSSRPEALPSVDFEAIAAGGLGARRQTVMELQD